MELAAARLLLFQLSGPVMVVWICNSLVDSHALFGVVADSGVRKSGWVRIHRLLDQSLVQRLLLFDFYAALVAIPKVVEGVFLIFNDLLIALRVYRLML